MSEHRMGQAIALVIAGVGSFLLIFQGLSQRDIAWLGTLPYETEQFVSGLGFFCWIYSAVALVESVTAFGDDALED